MSHVSVVSIRSILLVSVFSFGNLVLQTGLADDWNQYRGPRGDGVAAGEMEVGIDKPVISTAWKVPTTKGFSSFSIADGRAFTLVTMKDSSGSPQETCIALDIANGRTLWSQPLTVIKYDGGGDSGTQDNKGGDGPRSTPATDGDRVYVYDSRLGLHCLDAATGKTVWKQDIAAKFSGRNIHWNNATSPVLHGDRVIVAGGGVGQTFLAFDKSSGELIWKSGDEKFTHATPVVANINGTEQVVFYMQSGLIGINLSDGTELWRAPVDYRTSSAASPVIDGNRVYCSAGYGVGAALFEVGSDNSVNELWKKPNRLINHWSTPVVYEGHLYGCFGFKQYGKSPLQCIELTTGEVKWSQDGYGPGNCIRVGDKLVALSDSGEVVIVSAKSNRYTELSRSDVLNGKCWSMPAFSGGRIYVRSTEEGACVELK